MLSFDNSPIVCNPQAVKMLFPFHAGRSTSSSHHANSSDILVLHHPGRTADSREVLLRSGAASGFLIPSIEDAVPLAVLALLHNGAGIHKAEEGTPFATAGVAAANPFVRFLGRGGGRALSATGRHGGEARFIGLVALQTAHPKTQMLPSSLILHRLRRGGCLILLLRCRTFGSLWVALVHVTVPLGR